MPSPRHDAINLMFRDRPHLAVELLRDLKGIEMSRTPLVRVDNNDFNDRPSKDFRPDTVITMGPPQAVEHGIMASPTWLVSTPFAREHYGRGNAEGRVEGEAHALLRVLAARGIDVPDDARARICACTDQARLDTWLDRAVLANSVDDLFD